MKKLFSILLTFVMFLVMGSVAFAAPLPVGVSPEYPAEFIYEKSYNELWDKYSPGEVINFTIAPVTVAERPEEIPPAFTPNTFSITINEDENPALSDAIAFPSFLNVGTYYYTITETAGTTAGVTYDTTPRSLKIIVVRDATGALVPYMYSIWLGEVKVPGVDNDYEASSLIITKAVTGNLGDKNKVFDVNVTFTKPTGTTIGSTIVYSGGTIIPADWVGESVTVLVKVQDTTVVTFENIPKGVTWKVDEIPYADYETSYETPAAETTDFATGEINTSAADTVLITNNRTATPETGISLDSLPYILLLGFAVLGMGVLFFRKRQNTSF